MESLFPKLAPGQASIYGKISESTRCNPASNVDQIKQQNISIMVRGKKIDFNRKDPIFSLTKANNTKCSNATCKMCEIEEKKSGVKIKFCEFCGHFSSKHNFKSRPFPKLSERGQCWIVCDRKFHAKDIQVFYEDQIEKKEINIKKGEKIIRDKKEKLEEKTKQAEELIKEEKLKLEQQENETDVIQNMIKEVTNENELLNKRIQTRNDDINKKKDEKEELTDETENLKKEIINLEKRLNKLTTKYKDAWVIHANGRGRPAKQGQKKLGSLHSNSGSLHLYDTGSCIKDDDSKSGNLGKNWHVKRSIKSSLVESQGEHQCNKCIIF
jgi:hypothetical protein